MNFYLPGKIDRTQMSNEVCPHCMAKLSIDDLYLMFQRFCEDMKRRFGGRKILDTCADCGRTLGVAEMIKHRPACRKAAREKLLAKLIAEQREGKTADREIR